MIELAGSEQNPLFCASVIHGDSDPTEAGGVAVVRRKKSFCKVCSHTVGTGPLWERGIGNTAGKGQSKSFNLEDRATVSDLKYIEPILETGFFALLRSIIERKCPSRKMNTTSLSTHVCSVMRNLVFPALHLFPFLCLNHIQWDVTAYKVWATHELIPLGMHTMRSISHWGKLTSCPNPCVILNSFVPNKEKQ